MKSLIALFLERGYAICYTEINGETYGLQKIKTILLDYLTDEELQAGIKMGLIDNDADLNDIYIYQLIDFCYKIYEKRLNEKMNLLESTKL